MSSTVQRLHTQKLIQPPSFVAASVQYECVMGSVAYGVSNDNSDVDLYGFCVPPREQIFPHLSGEIAGFGTQKQRFEQYQQHHINDPSALAGKGQQFDITIYSIVKYFQLTMENNPNMLDSLFVPRRCVLYTTPIGERVRENRHLFLHKGSWHKFKGYAYQQMHKIRTKNPQPDSKRGQTVAEFGFDVKFAYHVVRLMDEAEQILTEADLDLERNREQLKAIRRGEWTLEQIEDYFARKEKALESAYETSRLPHRPDEAKIKQLLLDCLETYYGNLENCVVDVDAATRALNDIQAVLARWQSSGKP